MAKKKKAADTKKVVSLEKLQLEVKETLDSLGGCIEVVSVSSKGGDVRFLCRVHDDEYWLKVLADFLANEGSWYSFVGKKYFMSRGKLVFGWVLIFESEEIEKTTQEIRKLFTSIHANLRPTRAEMASDEDGLLEVPLPYATGTGLNDDKVRPVR